MGHFNIKRDETIKAALRGFGKGFFVKISSCKKHTRTDVQVSCMYWFYKNEADFWNLPVNTDISISCYLTLVTV